MFRTVTLCAAALTASPFSASAVVLTPDAVTLSTPLGSEDTTSPYTDDVLLDSLTFGTTVYDGTTGSLSVARRLEVTAGRGQINAEFGDNDTDDDADPNPFVKAGIVGPGVSVPMSTQESTDPVIQDPALLNAFNSRSVSEITDGEGNAFSSFKVLFENSLAFDDVGGDALPDIMFLERGMNDVFDVSLITGGTFESPVLSNPVTVDSGDFFDTEIEINTVEIRGGQALGVGGFDLSAFGLGPGDVAFGFVLETEDGPDLGGFFLAAEDPRVFGDPLDRAAVVPLPASGWMLLGALALGAAVRRRR